MGFFSCFVAGLTGSQSSDPYTPDLLHPAALPSFAFLAGGGHKDPRAAVYTMLPLGPSLARPFSCDGLNALDFGGGEAALCVLCGNGMVQELDAARVLASIYSQDELKALLRKRGQPVGGNKSQLSARLLDGGYRIDRRKYRRPLFELTDTGVRALEAYMADERQAILSAMDALKILDYSAAVSAYRAFDCVWGFIHVSGRNHTIFADFDIPFRRFDFISRYPMRELHNSPDFKSSLRACLLAGLMRGCQERTELASCFETICGEPIQCPRILDYYSLDSFDDREKSAVRSAMQENVSLDNRYVLEYYIARVLYLSRHE